MVLDRRHALVVLAQARVVVVRRAAAADGDAAVVGVHRVEDEEAAVAEDLVAAQPISSQNESGSGSVPIISE